MKVREIMTPAAETIQPEATVEEAAQRMRDLDIGGLPVVSDGKLVGFVTDRDLVVRGIADGKEVSRTKIREVMTPEVVCAYEDEDEREASQRMGEHMIRRLMVCDHEGHAIGMLSLGDLAVHGSKKAATDKALEDISRPARPKGRSK